MGAQGHGQTQQLDDSWEFQLRFGSVSHNWAASVRQNNRLNGSDARLDCPVDKSKDWQTTPPGWRIRIGDAGLSFAGETRLDNRSTLAARFNLHEAALDAEIICHAYACQGGGFERLLLGDFSFALFDERSQVLRLVRDPLGICPLYYHWGNGFCIASNSLDRLLLDSALTANLADKVIAEWMLTSHVYNQEETFFQAVKKCPRATTIRIDAKGFHSDTYWHACDVTPITYKSESDYADHLRELLINAISDRVVTTSPIAAHCSGGLDSTPIAIMAGRACRKSGKLFHTFNWSKPDLGDDPTCEDWDLARKTARTEEFFHHEIGATAESIKETLLRHDIARDGTSAFEYERALLNEAKQFGVREIFSGFGGDEILTTLCRDQHYDEIRSGRFVQAFKRLEMEALPAQKWRWARLSISYARLLGNSMLPTNFLMREYFQIHNARFQSVCQILNDQFAEFAATQRRYESSLLATTIKGCQHASLNSGYHQERIECWTTLGRRAGIKYAYPYLDKRIIEFALAIPSELYFKHGRPRHLYLKALGVNAPEYLRNRLKLSESSRATQLIRESLKALADPEVHALIAETNSPYVNTKALLAKCREPRKLNTENLTDCVIHLQTVTRAIHLLNINKKRESPY